VELLKILPMLAHYLSLAQQEISRSTGSMTSCPPRLFGQYDEDFWQVVCLSYRQSILHCTGSMMKLDHSQALTKSIGGPQVSSLSSSLIRNLDRGTG